MKTASKNYSIRKISFEKFMSAVHRAARKETGGSYAIFHSDYWMDSYQSGKTPTETWREAR